MVAECQLEADRCLGVIAEHAGLGFNKLMENTAATYRGRLDQAQDKLQSLERELDQMIRQRILPPSDALDKINRYETHLERGFYKTLHELQRLQAARKSGNVPVPFSDPATFTPTRISLQNGGQVL